MDAHGLGHHVLIRFWRGNIAADSVRRRSQRGGSARYFRQAVSEDQLSASTHEHARDAESNPSGRSRNQNGFSRDVHKLDYGAVPAIVAEPFHRRSL